MASATGGVYSCDLQNKVDFRQQISPLHRHRQQVSIRLAVTLEPPPTRYNQNGQAYQQ
jgi:hypothetical protein